MNAKRLLLALSVSLLCSLAASAAEIRGVVVKVQPDKKEFTLERGLGLRRTQFTFSTTAETKILLGDQPGSLNDLGPGKRVRVVYEVRDNTSFAQLVVANGGLLPPANRASEKGNNGNAGVLRRIAVTDREIVVVTKGAQGETETTYAIPEGLKIQRGDKVITLEDLKEGERVNVQVEKKDGKSVVVGVQVVLGQEEGESRIKKIRTLLQMVDQFLEMAERRREKP